MEDKELIQKFQIFEKQIMQFQEQLQAVEQGLGELGDLDSGLEDLVGKVGEEILAPIGRGVFVRAKLLSEELTVDVGERNLIKKSISDTKSVLGVQIEKLNGVREEIENQLELINSELTRTMMEHQEKKVSKQDGNSEHSHHEGCDCGGDCDCEENCGCDC